MVVEQQGDVCCTVKKTINKKQQGSRDLHDKLPDLFTYRDYVSALFQYGKLFPVQILHTWLPLNARMTFTSYSSEKMLSEVARRFG